MNTRGYVLGVWAGLAIVFIIFVSCGSERKQNWIQGCEDAGGHLVQTSPYNWLCVDEDGKILR